MSTTEFFDYLLRDERTAELGSQLAAALVQRVEIERPLVARSA